MGLLLLVGTGVIYVKGSLCSKFNEYYSKKNSKHNYWLRSVVTLTLGAYVVLVFCTTIIFRETRAESAINLIPLSSYFCIGENSYLWEVSAINLLNFAMFIPIGMLLKLAFCNNDNLNWKGTMVVGLLLSMAIEVLQFVLKKGLCEIDDVIHNVIGCMIGYGAYKIFSSLILRT